MSTTIRVDRDTHRELQELSRASGRSMGETVRDAAVALRRQRFGEQVSAEVDTLRSRPEAWAEYLAEADATAVDDGLTA